MTIYLLVIGLALGAGNAAAAPRAKAAPDGAPLTEAGEKLAAGYAATLTELQTEIKSSLPAVDPQKVAALQAARTALKKATADAAAAQKPLDQVKQAQGLVEHAKGKWIKGAEKGIAQAQADLKKATTAAERAAAEKQLAHWQANRAAGLKALQERQAALDKAKAETGNAERTRQAAQAAVAQARSAERSAATAVLAEVHSFLATDKLDAKLVKGVVLLQATPHGLAAFAQQSPEREALVGKLLADDQFMKEMLSAGGASQGKYGRAMEIYSAIQQVSPQARTGCLQRLALATALEHAVPTAVDPVKRYLHYEQAYLQGELDPAFETLGTWEYRMVVDCDAPDEILAWGRAMLRTYRPDHIANPNYGWRYVSAVKTDVRYGSQDVKKDRPELHKYQNIPLNGGVCGRRAFFGRFILRCFGIPVWGVTQHKHAALSHWTPKGWVVNLGAGFHASWWDKDEVAMSGSDFLLETQARAHGPEFLRVLRARWASRILGEPAYNGRKKIDGGFWSQVGYYQAVILAATTVELGPLGQELAEANEAEGIESVGENPVTDADKKFSVSPAGVITIPAVAHHQSSGPGAAMKSFGGGLQLHGRGGFKAQYVVDAPHAGRYHLTARVATLQTGQVFILAVNAASPLESAVPHTVGLWEKTPPVPIELTAGRNVLQVALREGSRGVTIKDFTLTPVP
jgi:hypothetical protein